jgi:MoaA/NifB/PqqE/SkfB family radical SAM enzyme
MQALNIFQSWGKVLTGKVPMLSIEITRECPLRCPGCYAYGDTHLGENAPNLRSVRDYRGDELVERILALVAEHKPLQVSLVGGEPMLRHRELSRVIPELSAKGIYTLVVTSGVVPIPRAWTQLPYVTVAISVDGNPEDHDLRRKPATYTRILRNIEDAKVNVHWTVVRKNVEEPGYMDRYLEFWNARPQVHNIWVSVYTPQLGEDSAERLTPENRLALARYFDKISGKYPKLSMHKGLMDAFLNPPQNPSECVFSKLSLNYTADLRSRVEPCVFGGTPNCAECGCSMTLGMEWLGNIRVAGPLRARHLIEGSLAVGSSVNKLLHRGEALRWSGVQSEPVNNDLVQIDRLDGAA